MALEISGNCTGCGEYDGRNLELNLAFDVCGRARPRPEMSWEAFKEAIGATVAAQVADRVIPQIISQSVEIGVITFATEVTEVLSFCSVEHAELSPLTADGLTSMGAAVRLAIRLLRDRREKYKAAGISSFVPWLVLMTDGGPSDEDWESAARELKQLGEQRKLVVFGVGIGSKCNFETLAKFCPADRPPLRLSGYDFQQFFHFMSRSLETVVGSEDAEGGFTIPTAVDPSPADR